MRTAMQTLALIGYEVGMGAGKQGCENGPSLLRHSKYLSDLEDKLSWEDFVKTPESAQKGAKALPEIARLAKQLATKAAELVAKDQFFLTLGGDHTCAIGTWSGVATAISPLALGLLWIDAHLDSHTMETTPSGNIHGMPLAALLGQGDKSLTEVLTSTPKLLPENVCIFGARSFEPAEQELLDKLKVKIIYDEEVQKRGFKTTFHEAVTHISENSQFYGLSIDLDAINPLEAPGVGTPEPSGIHAKDLFKGIGDILSDPRFIACEIVEFNPSLDQEQKTEKIAAELIKCFVQAINSK